MFARETKLAVALIVVLTMVVGMVAGCRTQRDDRRPAFFTPQALRINPTFTRLADLSGRGQLSGVEADIELRDQFDDSTKGAGEIYFELHAYRPFGPDIRGDQVGDVVRFDLSTVAAQRQHWQVIGTYRFRLPFGRLEPERSYVLSATYTPSIEESPQARRLFDRLIITPPRVREPVEDDPEEPAAPTEPQPAPDPAYPD